MNKENNTLKDNRENWLINAINLMKPIIKSKGYIVPNNIKVACSFCSVGNRYGAKNHTLGECWSDKSNEENKFHILITPSLEDKKRVLGVLVHELTHAIVGIKNGHNHIFKKCATTLGLEGKMTATTESKEFETIFAEVFKQLPDYPHKALLNINRKKQTTRLIKVVCEEHGYIARVSRKTLETLGCPICPICKESMTTCN